jgi:hypothetical protein
MAENKNAQLLKVSLLLLAVVTLVYGLIHLIIPAIYIKISGGDPIPSSWIRWFGGILIALGIGAIMVFRNPLKQGIFITVIALGTLFCGFTLLYSLFFENDGIGNIWATAVPAIVTLILSALFWISLKQAKDILWNEKE